MDSGQNMNNYNSYGNYSGSGMRQNQGWNSSSIGSSSIYSQRSMSDMNSNIKLSATSTGSGRVGTGPYYKNDTTGEIGHSILFAGVYKTQLLEEIRACDYSQGKKGTITPNSMYRNSNRYNQTGSYIPQQTGMRQDYGNSQTSTSTGYGTSFGGGSHMGTGMGFRQTSSYMPQTQDTGYQSQQRPLTSFGGFGQSSNTSSSFAQSTASSPTLRIQPNNTFGMMNNTLQNSPNTSTMGMMGNTSGFGGLQNTSAQDMSGTSSGYGQSRPMLGMQSGQSVFTGSQQPNTGMSSLFRSNTLGQSGMQTPSQQSSGQSYLSSPSTGTSGFSTLQQPQQPQQPSMLSGLNTSSPSIQSTGLGLGTSTQNTNMSFGMGMGTGQTPAGTTTPQGTMLGNTSSFGSTPFGMTNSTMQPQTQTSSLGSTGPRMGMLGLGQGTGTSAFGTGSTLGLGTGTKPMDQTTQPGGQISQSPLSQSSFLGGTSQGGLSLGENKPSTGLGSTSYSPGLSLNSSSFGGFSKPATSLTSLGQSSTQPANTSATSLFPQSSTATANTSLGNTLQSGGISGALSLGTDTSSTTQSTARDDDPYLFSVLNFKDCEEYHKKTAIEAPMLIFHKKTGSKIKFRSSLEFKAYIPEKAKEHSTIDTTPERKTYEYYTIPPLEELRKQGTGTVENLVIGRHGVGKVHFKQPIDLQYLNLDNITSDIIIKIGSVTVYPERDVPVGVGLNSPARVVLEDVFAYSKSTGTKIVGKKENSPYKELQEELFRALKAKPKTNIVSYDYDTGLLVFDCAHF
ncbi:hypothetical protein NEOKW01_1736 [Nematocida sp. AWRm80]|nr:hypothetical protein NEOKW01_1736 [Nematocida sp. AWRm80]